MLRGGTQWSPEPSSDPHPLSRLVLKALGPLNCRWVTPEERKWAGGCYPGPSNPVASRKFPPPPAASALLLEYAKASPHQKALLPSGHVHPEEGQRSTGAGGQQERSNLARAPPPSVVREARVPWPRALLASSLIAPPANSTGPDQRIVRSRLCPCPVGFPRTTQLVPDSLYSWYLKAAARPSPH